MTVPGRLLAAVVLILGAGQAAAGPADGGAVLDEFLAADPAGRLKLVDRILATHPDPLALEDRLRAGRRYRADVPTGWQVRENDCIDGQRRSYHVFVPESYDPRKKYAVRFALHGGVNRPDLLPPAVVMESRRRLAETGRADDMIVVLPLGQRGATWYDDVGHANLLAQLDAIKRLYNVDEDRVLMGGFSDGATGGYWTALHRPTPWAGFACLSGTLHLAGAGAYTGYPRNFLNRPIHATNGGIDPIYPAAIEGRLVEQIRRLGAAFDWKEYPDAGHDLSYRDTEDPLLRRFLRTTRRPTHRPSVIWETAEAANGRCDWVRIDEIRDVGNNAAAEASNLEFLPPPRFTMKGDPAFPGPGVRVEAVPAGSLAEKAGIRAGDVITQLEGLSIQTPADGQKAYFRKLLRKRPGDTISGVLVRDGRSQPFQVASPRVPAVPLYRRDRPSAVIEVHAQGNRVEVRVRNVARYTLLIDRRQFDLGRPLEVLTNGVVSFQARLSPDPAVLLRQAVIDNDRTTVYCARVEITVPARAGRKETRPDGPAGLP